MTWVCLSLCLCIELLMQAVYICIREYGFTFHVGIHLQNVFKFKFKVAIKYKTPGFSPAKVIWFSNG